MIKRLSAAIFAALLALAFGSYQPAVAAASGNAWMCSAIIAGQTGSRTIGGTTSQVPSGTLYVLNSRGCALIAAGDVGFFQSQGFAEGENIFSLVQTAITASTTTSTSTMTLPANAMIMGIMLNETANHSITGGVDIGVTNAGTEIASAVTLSGNGLVTVADSALTRVFASSGASVAKQITVTCHTSCNSGSINITVLYSFF